MVKVAVYGHTGRLGAPLVKILESHPKAELVYTKSKGQDDVGNLDAAEFVFLALPYGESEQYLDKLSGKRIIDLSVDHRSDPDWAYGLPEINKDKIKDASHVANPGCYATSILLGLLPLRGKIGSVCIQASSGISGAGANVKEEDNFVVYKEGNIHPQVQEIRNLLGIEDVIFVPVRVENTDRGIVSTIFPDYKGGEIVEEFKEFYKHSHFVRIVDAIETKNVINTNYCDIKPMVIGDKAIIISGLDNLIKGGSGQAIQNFNIMNGFDETLGLLL
ncbi:MAG: hypothetical protein Q7S70_01270 [bacterium]|nr:hypothetical protein [bacterium]